VRAELLGNSRILRIFHANSPRPLPLSQRERVRVCKSPLLTKNRVLGDWWSSEARRFLGGCISGARSIGTVSGEVVNRGTIAPGNSIGALTINGNYIHTAGATYAAEIDDQGHSDLIHATGIAALSPRQTITYQGTCPGILAQFHVLAFPGTSILQQWVEIVNAGSQPIGLKNAGGILQAIEIE
jgi:hypothetical protein